MAGLPRTRASSRASVTDSGSPVSTTERQNECASGVWRRPAHGSGKPWALRKNCRSASRSETSATGTPRRRAREPGQAIEPFLGRSAQQAGLVQRGQASLSASSPSGLNSN